MSECAAGACSRRLWRWVCTIRVTTPSTSTLMRPQSLQQMTRSWSSPPQVYPVLLPARSVCIAAGFWTDRSALGTLDPLFNSMSLVGGAMTAEVLLLDIQSYDVKFASCQVQTGWGNISLCCLTGAAVKSAAVTIPYSKQVWRARDRVLNHAMMHASPTHSNANTLA